MRDPLRDAIAVRRIHRDLEGPKPETNNLAPLIQSTAPGVLAGNPAEEISTFQRKLRLMRQWALTALHLAPARPPKQKRNPQRSPHSHPKSK